MSIAGLLNQSITVYGKSSYNSEGREVVGSGTSISARVQPKTKRKLLPNGSVINIDAIAFVASDASIDTDDRVDLGSDKYKVLSKYAVPGADGTTHHIELELIKWRQT